MSRRVHMGEFTPARFPRVSGDEPSYNLDNSYEVTFSPRERG